MVYKFIKGRQDEKDTRTGTESQRGERNDVATRRCIDEQYRVTC